MMETKRDNRIASRARRDARGFTLVEILVTIGLIILLGSLVAYPLLTGFAFMEKGIARADALSAARLAMDAASRELAEAMYVFDPPADGSFIAFLLPSSPPLGSAPIEPQTVAVRYWRALRDPAQEYWPFYRYDPEAPDMEVNPYYLARTEIPAPSYTGDVWNFSNRGLTRASFWYPDGHEYPLGEDPPVTWPTAQPGYPWLEAVRGYPGADDIADRYRWHRERAVGLTPDNADYNVPVASFAPLAVSGENLVPGTTAFPRDFSRYRARYPLWVNLAQYDPTQPAGFEYVPRGEINIFMRDETGERVLAYRTAVDQDRGDVWIVRAADFSPVYNTAAYPLRDVLSDPGQAEFAFGIDYDRGEVHFDFPAYDQIVANASMYIYDLEPVSSTRDLDPEALRDSREVVRGSTMVWVENWSTGRVTYYSQVEPAPAYSAIGRNRYAIDGLRIIFDSDAGDRPAEGDIIHVRYRYRNSPVDMLVVANYATKAVINIAVTVSKRDIAARTPQASRQDASLTTTVKLRNIPR